MTREEWMTKTSMDWGVEPRWGWVIVASAHVAFALWAGFLKSFGVLLPALTYRYDTNALVLGWVAAVLGATHNFGAVFGSVMSNFLGGRRSVILSGVVAASGLLLASASSSLLLFALSLIVLTGSGFGATLCIAKFYLGLYFDQRLSLAASIATMGLPESLIVFPIFTQFLLETYGIQGTLLISSALVMHLIPCGVLLRPPPRDISPNDSTLRTNNGYKLIEGLGNQNEYHSGPQQKDQVDKLLDYTLLTSLDMWALIISYTIFAFVNEAWVTFMVANATSKGFGGYVAISFSVIAGCSALVVSLLQGFVWRSLSTRVMSALAAGIGSASLFLNPFLNSFAALSVSVAMYGISLAVLNPGLICLAIETQGRDRASHALAWMGIASGIFRILFGFSTGLLYDITGNYNYTFVLLGAIMVITVPVLFIDTLVSKWRNSRNERSARVQLKQPAHIPIDKQIIPIQPKK